jgi:hypothetical protein
VLLQFFSLVEGLRTLEVLDDDEDVVDSDGQDEEGDHFDYDECRGHTQVAEEADGGAYLEKLMNIFF